MKEKPFTFSDDRQKHVSLNLKLFALKNSGLKFI